MSMILGHMRLNILEVLLCKVLILHVILQLSHFSSTSLQRCTISTTQFCPYPRAFPRLPFTHLLFIALSHFFFNSTYQHLNLSALPPPKYNSCRAGSYLSCSLPERNAWHQKVFSTYLLTDILYVFFLLL